MEQTPEIVPVTIEQKDIQIIQPGPMEMAQTFLAGGGDLENLEKMLVLQEKFDSMQAKKAYTQAMTDFKADPPKITKDKKVAFGNTKYSHASLGNVTESINTALARHGLSAAWKINQDQSGITVTCTITHKLGHSENTSIVAGADNSGKKNGIQSIGSTISYLQRYTILSLTGLATHDQDDDGVTSEPKQPGKTYLEQISEFKSKNPAIYKKVCIANQLDSLDCITNSDAQFAIIRDLNLYGTPEWTAWESLRDSNLELLETWQDPVDIHQCVEATDQAKQIIDQQNA